MSETWRERAARISPLLQFAGGGSGGEDGVLEKLFEALPIRGGLAVDLGRRADGSSALSRLASARSWDMVSRASIAPREVDALLAESVSGDIDCLAINVHGLDYWVWDAIEERHAPSLVTIEFNPYVDPDVAATIDHDGPILAGGKDYAASLTALLELGERKGYRLVHVHGCRSLYFVRRELELGDGLALRTPLGPADLETLTDADAFYDGLCDGRRPAWADAPGPDVALSPWLVLAPDEESTEVDLEGISLEVMAGVKDANWYMQRKTFEEKRSLLYPLIGDAGFANFVDIGANVGLISILARRRCPGIRNLAVEADPRLVRLLRRNFRHHGLAGAEVVTAVAGDEDLNATGFALNPTSTLDNRVRSGDWPAVQVPMVRMDRVLEQLDVRGPTFFKVDTQGFERQVLGGLEPWLQTAPGWMLKMEFAPFWLRSQGTDPRELLAYVLERYELAEFPARVRFGTASLESLFETPIRRERIDEFLAHVVAQDKLGRGWVDVLLRPAG